MSILKKDIENTEKGCSHEWSVYGGSKTYWELKARIEALKFADKRFEEFVERLREKFCRYPLTCSTAGVYCKNCDKIIETVEEFNRPRKMQKVAEGFARNIALNSGTDKTLPSNFGDNSPREQTGEEAVTGQRGLRQIKVNAVTSALNDVPEDTNHE